MIVEVCVQGADNAAIAAAAGADRLELCDALALGGLSPTAAMLADTLARVDVAVMAMVRPRAGDFTYEAHEIDAMCATCAAMAAADGLVLGCLSAGAIDTASLRRLMAAAGPRPVTFHRAFDEVADQFAALETLIDCGVARVLTSGAAPDAVGGIARLRALVTRAAGRITILACGGLRPATIARVQQETGVTELHFAAPVGADRAHTDPALVAATIAALRA